VPIVLLTPGAGHFRCSAVAARQNDGGGARLVMLLTVRLDATPHGEAVKVAATLVLIRIGCFVYRKTPGGAA
jgi:hypothetical protein